MAKRQKDGIAILFGLKGQEARIMVEVRIGLGNKLST